MRNPFVRNWRLVAGRGWLAILFGLVVLFWPRLDFNVLVVLFGIYACLDGAYTLASVYMRATTGPLEWWPVVLEGVASVALGVFALVYPVLSHPVIKVIAVWGIVTGILEILLAARLPRELASHWYLAMGGLASLFLGAILLTLPLAVATDFARTLGIYAIVFGVLVCLAARRLRRASQAAGRPA